MTFYVGDCLVNDASCYLEKELIRTGGCMSVYLCMYICMHALMYDYIYVLFVCRI